MKRYNIKYNIGKSKYVINYHNGIKKHNDNSDFFDIAIFKNKKDFNSFEKTLITEGYVEK